MQPPNAVVANNGQRVQAKTVPRMGVPSNNATGTAAFAERRAMGAKSLILTLGPRWRSASITARIHGTIVAKRYEDPAVTAPPIDAAANSVTIAGS